VTADDPRPAGRTHNHFTRDIKPLGQCPGCDEYWQGTRPAASGGATEGELEKVSQADGVVIDCGAVMCTEAAKVRRVEALIAFYDRHEYASANVDDFRRALDGTE
jgi:hypothetical protein